MMITYKKSGRLRTDERNCRTKKEETKFKADVTKIGGIIISVKI